jgi:stage V sporulation protein R
MELIDQHTKKIMEGCKERARSEGLRFQDETLEYVVTNKDLLELGPKNMIPTLYDYWVHDIEVLKEKGRYELYPTNPYETVINTRPAISFYNDNNPDWLNVMIFYHVLAHIDFFQNNMLFKNTWSEDFEGKALSDKRLISKLRSEHGRKVDYVIEFARGLDNLVAYYQELSRLNHPPEIDTSKKMDFYFDVFLQRINQVKWSKYLKEIERYNDTLREFGPMGETIFFTKVIKEYPEFEALFVKDQKKAKGNVNDIMQFLLEHSSILKKEENSWMRPVIQIVRNTSLFFQPQIRTKILNEGWASYWHEKLFLKDDRIRGNEVNFASVNAKITSLPRVGLNPYALGMRLFYYIEEREDEGKLSYDFQKIMNAEDRRKYDKDTGHGRPYIFDVRENFSDFMFINHFVDQDFVDQYRLFTTGRRLNRAKGVWEYFVESRNGEKYKRMLLDSLYHPPNITVDEAKTGDACLYLQHEFEGKPLIKEFIPNTMLGLEYFWGAPVKLETSEPVEASSSPQPNGFMMADPAQKDELPEKEPEYQRVVYTMEKKKIHKTLLT